MPFLSPKRRVSDAENKLRLLLCLCEKHEWDSRRELADFAGISRTNLTSGLQRLTMKGFLKIEEVKEPKPSRKSKAAGEVQGKAEKPETRQVLRNLCAKPFDTNPQPQMTRRKREWQADRQQITS